MSRVAGGPGSPCLPHCGIGARRSLGAARAVPSADVNELAPFFKQSWQVAVRYDDAPLGVHRNPLRQPEPSAIVTDWFRGQGRVHGFGPDGRLLGTWSVGDVDTPR